MLHLRRSDLLPLKDFDCEGEGERAVERGVWTNEPFLEFVWCDDNLRTLQGVWNSGHALKISVLLYWGHDSKNGN